MKRRQSKNSLIILVVTAAIVLLLLYLVIHFNGDLREFVERIQADKIALVDNIINAVQLVLLGILAYIVVRALNFLVFGMFRLRRGFDAPTLVQNVFSIVAFTLLFLVIFSWEWFSFDILSS